MKFSEVPKSIDSKPRSNYFCFVLKKKQNTETDI